MTKTIILPCIGLNGTSANMLLDQYVTVRRDILTAIDTMQRMEFHARDYVQQQNGTEIWKQAQEQYMDRLNRLNSVVQELDQIIEHVDSFRK